MKNVLILRHAPKDISGQLTPEAKGLTSKLKGLLGTFDLIISSDMPRAQETTYLLTDIKPIIDKRASIPNFTQKQEHELFELSKKHPSGIAGVIFDTPLYRELAEVRGKTLVALIKETLAKLPENGRALIISHDGSMVAAEMILKNKPLIHAERNYKPLSGYRVNEKLELEYFSLTD